MPYVTQAALKGKIPDDLLLQALDDNGDGVADDGVWDSISDDVDKAINGPLEGTYDVPLAEPYPYVVTESAIIFACEAIYMRRGLATKDVNPWVTRADAMRKRLEDIGSGTIPLTKEKTASGPEGTVISETSKLNTGGNLML